MKNTKPELRFAGFTDDWEQRKLGELCSLITKGTTPIDKSDKGTINFVKIENIDSISGEIKPEMKISISEHNGYLKRSQLQENDILFSIAGTLGRVATVNIDILPANTNQALAIIRLKEGNLNYISIFLKGKAVKDFIKRNPTIGAQPNLSLTQVADLFIQFPSLSEQQRIGTFFRTLDSAITLHQRKCDALIKVKKSMLQKMFPKNGKSKPEVRFAGFTDDWEQRKFSEVFDLLQNNTLSRAELNDQNGKIQNVHYGDVLIKFDEYTDIQKSELPFITDDNLADKYSHSKLQNGDMVIADTAEDETVGKCTEIGNIGTISVVSGLHTIPCRPKQKYAEAYLGFYMNSSAYHNQLFPLMQGIKVTSISRTAIEETILQYPKDTKEQQRIGTFFRTLDSAITLHQREVEKLTKLKKALLSKMFI